MSSERDHFIIIYVAPTKAICSQIFSDWKMKFSGFSLTCLTSTGDSDFVDIHNLDSQVLLIATPEKLNSTVKKFRDVSIIWNRLKLCFIDEIHLIGEHERGSVLEVLITRIKLLARPRFICTSASLSNVQDVAQWLSVEEESISSFTFGEEFRMSPIKKFVCGFIRQKNQSIFQFETNLNYRLPNIINTYSKNKPVLIFCTTRGGAVRTATDILKQIHFTTNLDVLKRRQYYSQNTINVHLKAYHHAGMDVEDRKLVENAFRSGCISVLACTSTLAMGVNLPAYLVIIKNTEQLVDGEIIGYSSTQLSQMVGRAGRPQFDDEGVAVIMTAANLKAHYVKLLNEFDVINSCLESRLTEHMLCEIILRTVCDFKSILRWISSTFFYVRISKFPQLYGLPENCNSVCIDQYVQDRCLKEIRNLQSLKLINYNLENDHINPTDLGEIIFKHNLELDTFQKMFHLTGEETVEELLYFIASCSEMNDIRLRHCEKSYLNSISRAKGRFCLRFPIYSRIKTASLKVVCLLQAQLGQVIINDYSLKQENEKILQSALRILNGLITLLWLYDYPWTRNSESDEQNLNNSTIPTVAMKFPCILNALELRKSIHFRRWLNYPLINLYGSSLLTEKQISKLIEANLLTSSDIQKTETKKLENILDEKPPFGRRLHDFLDSIPKYEMDVEQKPSYNSSEIEIILTISQKIKCKDCAILLVGSAKKYLVGKWFLEYSNSEETNVITKQLKISNDETLNPLSISLISINYGGIDLHTKYHFISLSNINKRCTSTPYLSTEDSIQRELSIGYSELITHHDRSVVSNVENINNYKPNLWPEPTSLSLTNTNIINDNNKKAHTLLKLELPLTPIVNTTKMSSNQTLKSKKCKLDIQNLQNQTKTCSKTPFTFTWTPKYDISNKWLTNTPVKQTSLLDYIHTKCKDSGSNRSTYELVTKVETSPMSESLSDKFSVQKPIRKRFKWDPEDKMMMDTNLNQSSTFTLTPVLDEYSYANETSNISNILIKDNTPELFSAQRSFISNIPLCLSCPATYNAFSQLTHLSVNSEESTRIPNSTCDSNTVEGTQLTSNTSIKSDSLSDMHYKGLITDDEEAINYEENRIATPINKIHYKLDNTILTTKPNLYKHNTVLLSDLSAYNFPIKPYTVDIACSTPGKRESFTHYKTEKELNFDDTESLPYETLNLNGPSLNEPKISKGVKSLQTNQPNKMNQNIPQIQRKITWSKDIIIDNPIQEKQETHQKNEKEILLFDSKQPFSIDHQLISDGWCELACLIKVAELSLLHEQIKLNSISMTETPQPTCSKNSQEHTDSKENYVHHTDIPKSATTTLTLNQTGIEKINVCLTPSESYIDEE
ncbi:putative ATP-dependent DNA helicase HFM1 [Schistosoma japonicum]|uniref:Putative ATP-dependent DNA helicase HFM1 n=1 Tax=Schistosoma japonicum TaxID=6182 RepID=A0A4Z2DNY7_SCHJA|nr:putative ATP-dependent DNA helicase HFM1 [Schistosoma japonicum]